MCERQASRNHKLIASYLSAFATGSPASVADHVSDNFKNTHFGVLGNGCEGKQVYQERLVKFLASFENLSYAPMSIIADENEGAARYKMSFTEAGKSIEVYGMMWFEFSDGLISARTDCWDSLSYLKQSGATAESVGALLGNN